MDRLVFGTLALKHAGILLGSALDQHGNLRMKVLLIEVVCSALDDLDESVEALEDHFARRVIGHLGCRRASTLRIDEGECLGVPSLLRQGDRLLEVFFRLTRKTNDDISRQGDIRNPITDAIDQIKIVFARVLAIHKLKNAV